MVSLQSSQFLLRVLLETLLCIDSFTEMFDFSTLKGDSIILQVISIMIVQDIFKDTHELLFRDLFVILLQGSFETLCEIIFIPAL